MKDNVSTHDLVTVDGHTNFASLFVAKCTERGSRTAHRVKENGQWQDRSWADYLHAAKRIGNAMLDAGVGKSDVALILSEDRAEWMYTDMGAICVGAITSGVYPTNSPEQLQYIFENSGARFIFVENAEQLEKFYEIEANIDHRVQVVIFDPKGAHMEGHDNVATLDAFYERGASFGQANPQAFEAAMATVQPYDTATLIYTSGTTGPPKGVMISHQNILAAISATLTVFQNRPDHHQICFLPLSHVMERLGAMWVPVYAGTTVSFAESAKTIVDDLRDVRPHVFAAVPRVWEKVYAKVNAQIDEAPPTKRKLFQTAIADGKKRLQLIQEGKKVPMMLQMRYNLWDKIVFSKLREKLGLDRLEVGVSAAAPIPAEILVWYSAMGMPILEAYGQSEVSGLANANPPEDVRYGSVGPQVEPTKVKLSDEGEILFHGPLVFQGYWNMPEKTAETMTEDGWLRSGDLGSICPDGFLTITGRIKDIIVTAGGKNIAPAGIENALKTCPYVADVMLVGEALPFITALVMIDQDVVDKVAQDEGIECASFDELARHPRLRELIQKDVDRVNEKLSRVEQIKDFRVIEVELMPSSEELTPTLKLRRDYVVHNHADLIEQMYGDQIFAPI